MTDHKNREGRGSMSNDTEKAMLSEKERLRAILDLASARLRNPPLEAMVEHDLKEIVRLSTLAEPEAK